MCNCYALTVVDKLYTTDGKHSLTLKVIMLLNYCYILVFFCLLDCKITSLKKQCVQT